MVNIVCHYCNQPGHKASSCPSNPHKENYKVITFKLALTSERNYNQESKIYAVKFDDLWPWLTSTFRGIPVNHQDVIFIIINILLLHGFCCISFDFEEHLQSRVLLSAFPVISFTMPSKSVRKWIILHTTNNELTKTLLHHNHSWRLNA